MAVWQFKLSIVPVVGLRKHSKSLGDILPEYQSNNSDPHRELVESPNYWVESEALMNILTRELSQLFPERESWSSDAKMFGTEHGDSIEIWPDDIRCAFDVRKPNMLFLNSIIDIANVNHCILVMDDGKLISPDITELAPILVNSRAVKFVSDPVAFLTRDSS
jgi:hypothetical protein